MAAAAKAVRPRRAPPASLQDTVAAHGSLRAAAAVLGVSSTTLWRRVQAEKEAAPAEVARPAQGLPPDLAGVLGRLANLLEVQKTSAPKAKKPTAPKIAEATKAAKPVAGGTLEAPEAREGRIEGRRFFVTTAQNNSLVHEGLLASAKQWCSREGGKLLVARISYNAKAYGQPHEVLVDGEGAWYAPELEEHFVRGTVRLAPDLVFCADVNISPSAVDPLSGLESYTKSSSGVFASPKHEMRSMASMRGTPARMLYTTGAVTLANYIPRKAGQKAEHHHVYGGLVVEVDADGAWFVRQVNASADGSFQDLDRRYTPEGSEPATVEALTPGDVHIEKLTEAGIADAIWAPGGMVDALQPRFQFVHDLIDFKPRNHHNLGSAYFLARQRAIGEETVEQGMQQAADFLRRATRPWCETVVVESNHDQAFAKWLETADGHADAPNARYWHFWNYRIFQGIEQGAEIFPFELAVREKAPDLQRTRFLQEDESFVVCPDSGGIECGMHGHRGPNGSRGSAKGYRVLGLRTTTAHTHSAGVWGGQYCAGVSGDLEMGYNKGPSSWSHSHVVTYPSGKRAIVTMRGTRWRGEPVKQRIRVRAISQGAAA